MEKIPIRQGLFAEGTSGSLVGLHCTSCGRTLPPLTIVCYCCGSADLEKVALSNRGKLYSYTVVYQPHKHFETPYAAGYIDLPEGIRFFARLKEREGLPFRVGMDMGLLVETLWVEEGKEIVGPFFEPLRRMDGGSYEG
jgi:uncharacterized OB-fold protein